MVFQRCGRHLFLEVLCFEVLHYEVGCWAHQYPGAGMYYDTYQGLLNAEISGWEYVQQKARVTDNHNHEEESEKDVESWESSKFSRCTFLFLLGLSLFLLMFLVLVFL